MAQVVIKGACGKSMLIDRDFVSFAYPVEMVGHELLYIGLKDGKKLYADCTLKELMEAREVNGNEITG